MWGGWFALAAPFVRGIAMRLSTLLIVVLFAGQLPAGEIKVAISPFEPFVIPGNPHRGYSIDLMREVGNLSGIEYKFVLKDGVKGKLTAIQNGEVDMAIGGVSITGTREEEFNFSHPEYNSGLSILTKRKKSESFWQTAQMVWFIVKKPAITGFLILIMVAAVLMWLVEKGKDSFNDTWWKGIPEGLYFSIVTGSTVGYGDHTPAKPLGKLLASFLIIIALPMFCVFNAQIIHIYNLEDAGGSTIQNWGDLINKKVITISGTTSEEWVLNTLQQEPHRCNKFVDAIAILRSGDADAIVYDAPTLAYFCKNNEQDDLVMAGKTFAEQDLAFVFGSNKELEEKVNWALVKIKEQGLMRKLRDKWFGEFNR